jgi:hypothetical protein
MEYGPARAFVTARGFDIVREAGNGIVAVAVGRIGEQPIAGGLGDDFCVRAYVVRDPAKSGFPDPVKSVARAATLAAPAPPDIDFVELGGEFRAFAASSHHSNPAAVNTQKWFHALRPGIGVANPVPYPKELGGGTIGLFVRDASGAVYLVSCNHVLARVNAAVAGEMIVQPATMDLDGYSLSTMAGATDVQGRLGVAKLTAWNHVAVHGAAPVQANLADVAMAKLVDQARDHGGLARLPYGGKLRGTVAYSYDRDRHIVGGPVNVFKVGRTTGYTEGQVTALHMTVNVALGADWATFSEQIIVRPGTTTRAASPRLETAGAQWLAKTTTSWGCSSGAPRPGAS